MLLQRLLSKHCLRVPWSWVLHNVDNFNKIFHEEGDNCTPLSTCCVFFQLATEMPNGNKRGKEPKTSTETT